MLQLTYYGSNAWSTLSHVFGVIMCLPRPGDDTVVLLLCLTWSSERVWGEGDTQELRLSLLGYIHESIH